MSHAALTGAVVGNALAYSAHAERGASSVGIFDNMCAKLIVSEKSVDADGSILQIVIWQVPKPVPPTSHGFKYRLVYVRDGQRVVGFDNERGKGDHMHLGQEERPYLFKGVAQLLDDFAVEVGKRRE